MLTGVPLTLPELEPRLLPSAPADLGGGVVRVRTGWEVVAFPGWAGLLNVLDVGDKVYVGPGPGGAPREAAFDEPTGDRLLDQFVGDPADRSGLTLLGVGLPIEVPAPRPHLTAGDPAGFAVYIDDERDGADTAATVAALPGLFPRVPLAFTTDRPDRPPGSYATVVLGAPLDFAGVGVLGLAAGSIQAIAPTQFGPQAVYVAAGLTPAYTAVVAAHELGHFFGLGHTTAPLDLMADPPDARATFGAGELAEIVGHLP